MISSLVTLLVGLLLLGLVVYLARVFFPGTIAHVVAVVCGVLAIILVIYTILGFVGGGSTAAALAAVM